MRSKEEMALHYGLCNCDEAYKSRNLTAPDCPFHGFAVEEAMEEYSNEQKKPLIEALNLIAQMSDCGSLESTIIRMKEIASKTIKDNTI